MKKVRIVTRRKQAIKIQHFTTDLKTGQYLCFVPLTFQFSSLGKSRSLACFLSAEKERLIADQPFASHTCPSCSAANQKVALFKHCLQTNQECRSAENETARDKNATACGNIWGDPVIWSVASVTRAQDVYKQRLDLICQQRPWLIKNSPFDLSELQFNLE